MLVETEIIYTDESQSNIMGKDVNKATDFDFNLGDVSGIMSGDEKGKTSIIFLHGRDLLINIPFKALRKRWRSIKFLNDEGEH